MKYFIFSLLATVFVLGCSNDDNATQYVEFTTIAKGNHYLFYESNPTQINSIFTDSDTWNQFVTSAGSEYFSEINIDFSQYEILAMVGEKQSTATNLNILNIEEHPFHLLVVSEVKKGDAMIISRPYHIVKIPKTNKAISWNIVNE